MRRVLDLLLPRKCPFCGGILAGDEADLCALCRKSLPFTAGGRGQKSGEFFRLCVSPLYYRDTVRSSLHRFKFQNKRTYRFCYTRLMAERVREELAGQYDLLTWVPVSMPRRLRRGYDQAYLLASALGEELGLRPVRTLRKRRHTRPQTEAGSPEKRRANVSGVYRAVRQEHFFGKNVLLVDDILTTGATLSEASRTLLMAGAETVCCATVARTG